MFNTLLPIFTSLWGGEGLCWFSELLLAHPAPTCPDSPQHGGGCTPSINSPLFPPASPIPYPKTSLPHDLSIFQSVQPSLRMVVTSTLPSPGEACSLQAPRSIWLVPVSQGSVSALWSAKLEETELIHKILPL